MNFSKIAALLFGALLSLTVRATTIEMEVNGLVCAFCAQGIEKTLKRFPATEAVLVSLEHHLVAVALNEGTDIDDAALRQSLTEAGYTVVGIERTDATLETLRAGMKPHD